MRGLVFHIPEELAATPTDGPAICNAWWTVHPEKGVTFYTDRKRPFGLEPGEQDEPAPQCNRDQYTAEHIQKRLYPDCTTKQIPVVFIGHAIKEMHVQRKAAAEQRVNA